MADKKISELTELDEAPASDDLIEIADVSDTTMSVDGTNKKVTRTNLLGNPFPGDIVAPDANDIKFVSGAKMERDSGHLVLTPESSKLVKIQVLRQDNTTNSYQPNTVLLSGWGFKPGDDANRNISEAITFGITFSSDGPTVVANSAGYRSGSDPVNISQLDNGSYFYGQPSAVTTTGFTIRIGRVSEDGASTTVLSSTVRWGYSWLAIGELDPA